jgi:hypothetical protein
MTAVMLPPLVSSIRAIERSLAIFGVAVLERAVSSSLHRLEYEHNENTLAVVGWTDELQFVRHPDPQIVALVRAHHALFIAR